MSFSGSKWQHSYWLVAAIPALLLFGSDGLEILMYDHARAPNAGVAGQLTLMLLFYAVWPLVPWSIWQIIRQHNLSSDASTPPSQNLAIRLGLFGVVSNLLHMMLLAVVLRTLYSPSGWGLLHLVDSVVELWIQHAGLWYFVYLVFCLGIYRFVTRNYGRDKEISSLVFKVRSGTKIVPVDIADVSWVEACGNYVQLHTKSGVFLVRRSLATIEQETKDHSMVRSHRGALVNTAFVSAVVRNSVDGQYRIELSSGEFAPLSRRRLAVFKTKLVPH